LAVPITAPPAANAPAMPISRPRTSGVLRTNQLGYVMLFTSAVVFAGGIIIRQVEPEIGTLADGFWWSLVTATTVGYGDIAPKTGEGRVLAVILMLVGIGTIGMITGSIATYFIGSRGSKNPHVQHLQRQLDKWEDMTTDERHKVMQMLRVLNEEVPVAHAELPGTRRDGGDQGATRSL
jgi:voltage-gated potassium channel